MHNVLFSVVPGRATGVRRSALGLAIRLGVDFVYSVVLIREMWFPDVLAFGKL